MKFWIRLSSRVYTAHMPFWYTMTTYTATKDTWLLYLPEEVAYEYACEGVKSR